MEELAADPGGLTSPPDELMVVFVGIVGKSLPGVVPVEGREEDDERLG